MRPMQGSVAVVGNGVAGFACASRLGEHGVDVTMIGPGLPHDRPPLSKRALATGRLPLLADAEKLAARGIRHLDGRVVGRRSRRPRADGRAERRRRSGRAGAGADRLGHRPHVPAAADSGRRGGGRELDRRRHAGAGGAGGRGRAPDRRDRRRPDRHRDGGDALGPPRGDAGRHARPPARPVPAAAVGGGAGHALGARRDVPRQRADRRGRPQRGRLGGAHDDPRRPPLRRGRVRRRLPHQPPGDARAGRAFADHRRRRHPPRSRAARACSHAATASRSRIRATAGSRSRTGTTRSTAAGRRRTACSASARPTIATRTSSPTSARSGSSRSDSPPTPSTGATRTAS